MGVIWPGTGLARTLSFWDRKINSKFYSDYRLAEEYFGAGCFSLRSQVNPTTKPLTVWGVKWEVGYWKMIKWNLQRASHFPLWMHLVQKYLPPSRRCSPSKFLALEGWTGSGKFLQKEWKIFLRLSILLITRESFYLWVLPFLPAGKSLQLASTGPLSSLKESDSI